MLPHCPTLYCLLQRYSLLLLYFDDDDDDDDTCREIITCSVENILHDLQR